MVNNGCFQCTERHIGCHSNCEKYLTYMEENEKIKQNRAEYNKRTFGFGTQGVSKILCRGKKRR